MTNHASTIAIPVRRALRGSLIAACIFLGACAGNGGGSDGGESGVRAGYRPIPAIQESGEQAFTGHNYPLAESEFKIIIDRDPGNSRARYWLGRTLLAVNKPAEAREQLEVAYAADIENDKIYSALCQSLYDDKKMDELFRLLRQRTAEHGSVRDYLLLGEYSQKAGDLDEAQIAFLTAARLDQGKNVEPQLALAKFYESAKNDVEASRRLRMAYFIRSDDAEVNQRLLKFGHKLAPGLGIKPLERP